MKTPLWSILVVKRYQIGLDRGVCAGGRSKVRTCDPSLVRRVLYR
jgi:hypothetical protein